eukprot:TRINITY_DN16908_c0_g2_i1.p1 TRINITY_DN16908_c0_g2~~TRINITY_DN16908_c0_g2_i1.p1  ORF type:complete len:646 (+),score=214.97 TRINITY_DN16908_c0_g2_i1:324-2261(+)
MSDTRYEGALLEHFYYQMNLFTEADWIYYGDEASGRFIGLRRPFACELHKNCSYGAKTTTASPLPTVQENTIIRVLSDTSNVLKAYTTSTTSGSDPVSLLYTQTDYIMKNRVWYTSARDATTVKNVFTAPYLFTGGVLGVTVARKVVNSAGALQGVLAADYELTFLDKFLSQVSAQGNSVKFIVTHDKKILANSLGQAVHVNNAVRTTAQVGGIINSATQAVFAAHSGFGSNTADWTDLISKSQRGEFTYNSQKYFYDAIGVLDPRWVVVIASSEADYYPVEQDSTRLCVLSISCRQQLMRANTQFRASTIQYFQERTVKRLESAVAAVVTLDNSYNMGNLHSGWCTTCGKLSWSDTTERTNLKNHISHVFDVFPELAWLYVGLDNGGGDNRRVVGYRRANNQKQLWITCAGSGYCTDSGTTFFTETDSGTRTVVENIADNKWWERTWYTTGSSLAYDKVGWTTPYVFGDGDLGVTLARKGFGGDFSSTGFFGVWAADFTLTFLKDYLVNFEVPGSTVVYIMDNSGNLIAANRDIAVKSGTNLIKAEQSTDVKVSKSAKAIYPVRATLRTDYVYSVLIQDTDPYYIVDAVPLRDTNADTTPGYEWTMVMVSIETDLYDLPETAAGANTIASALLLVAGIALAILM